MDQKMVDSRILLKILQENLQGSWRVCKDILCSKDKDPRGLLLRIIARVFTSVYLISGIHLSNHFIILFMNFLSLMFWVELPRVPEVFFSVSWQGKKTSGNGDQLTDHATLVSKAVLPSAFCQQLNCPVAHYNFPLLELLNSWYNIQYNNFNKLLLQFP